MTSAQQELRAPSYASEEPLTGTEAFAATSPPLGARRVVRSPVAIGGLSLTSTLAALELAWHLTTPSPYLPRPTEVLWRAFLLFRDGSLLADTEATLAFIGAGVALASILGISLAVGCHRAPIFRWALSPLVELTRGIAPLALIPLFMMMFGIGPASKIAITVWVAWIPVFINCLEGFSNVDPALMKVVRSFDAKPRHVVFEVILPSAVPFLLSGVRLAFGAAFLAVVASEMFGSTRGLGFFILESSQTFHIVDMYAAITVVGVLGWSINGILVQASRRLAPWRFQ